MPEEFFHLLRGFQVELIRVEAEPPLFVKRFACTNRDQNVLRLGIAAAQVVRIVCGDDLDSGAASDFEKGDIGGLLVGQAVIHELDVEVIRPENLEIIVRRCLRLAASSIADIIGNHAARKTAGEAELIPPCARQAAPCQYEAYSRTLQGIL